MCSNVNFGRKIIQILLPIKQIRRKKEVFKKQAIHKPFPLSKP